MQNLKVYCLLCLCIAISVFTNQSYAQQSPKIEWQKCYGGSFEELATKIIQTTDGNYVIAGYTESDDGFVSGFHGVSGSSGRNDGWVINLDPTGKILWQRCLGGSDEDQVSSVIQTSDGGYAVAGYTSSNDGDVSGNHGGVDAWVVKLDIDGNIQWQKCLGGSGYEIASCIIESKDEGSGFLIVGSTTSNDGDVSGRHSGHDGTDSTSDLWVVKLSLSGAVQWQKCFGGSGNDQAISVIQTTDHCYAIVGNTNSKDGDVSGLHIGKNSYGDIWIVKLSGSGAIQWQKCLGGSYQEYGQAIIQTSDGGYAVAGQTNSDDGDVSGLHGAPSSFDGMDAWIIKLSSSGNIAWQKCLGGSLPDAANSIIQTHTGDYVIAGETRSNDGDVSGNHAGVMYWDMWVVKIDSARNIIWQKCLGGKDLESAASIIQASDGGYAIAGNTTSNDGDVSGNNSIYYGNTLYNDIWIVTLTPEVNSVENSSANELNFSSVYPNPSLNQIHLQLYHSLSVKQIQFFNLLGMQYYPDYKIENTMAEVDVHDLPTGSYVMRVSYLNSDIGEVRKFLHYH